ncbi:hypothetical protein K2X33_06455 [bacterium]|nr:hypothetical protein [bacterium]
MSRMLVTAATVFVLAACGREITQRLQDPQLMKTWENTEADGGVVRLPMKSFIKYSGDDFEEVYTFYEKSDRAVPAAELRYSGTFFLHDKQASGNRAIDFDYRKAQLVALTEKGRKILEGLDVCGFETFEINKPNEITNIKKGLDCPFRQVPTKQFGLYRIEDGKLLVGDGWGFKSVATAEKDRPSDLDRDNPLVASQRNL